MSKLQSVFAGYVTLSLSLCLPIGGSAQSASAGAQTSLTAHTDASLPPLLKLHYDSPMTFSVGTEASAIISDFKCDADGSVFVPMTEDLSQIDPHAAGASFEIIGLASSGDVVRFAPQPISDYRNLVSLVRYFVSSSHVYLLEMADKIDPMDSRKVTGRSRLIQIFDHKGQLTQTIVLEPGIDPLNLAAFESGEIVLLSPNTLNKTTRLLLIDDVGRPESELSLFDNDFASQLDQAAKYQNGETLSRVLATASLTPRGQNLLLTTSQVNFPVLELNQHGLVRATQLALPPGATVQSILPSDDGLLHALVGNFRSLSSPNSTPASDSSASESKVFSPAEIDVFYPQDGSLLRRISLAVGLMPVCAFKDRYTFLEPREEDGRLQVIHATSIPQ